MSELVRAADQERVEQTAEIINKVITPDLVKDNLEALQRPAPTTDVLSTRAPVIEELLLNAGVDDTEATRSYLGLGSPAVFLKDASRLLFSAHADEPTYLLPAPTNETSFELMPICAHRPKVSGLEFTAAVLRYNDKTDKLNVISEGVIGTDLNKEGEMFPYYTATTKPKNGFFPGLDRVVYTPKFAFDKESGQVVGDLDNAAGIAASVAATEALVKIAEQRGMSAGDFKARWVFPDAEEGLPEDPAFFARGARNIAHNRGFQHPEYIINVDGHDAANPPGTAAYAAYVSDGKGPIVPTSVYSKFHKFLTGLSKYGVEVSMTEEVGTVSRSDCAGWMEVHNRIMPVGYYVENPHHNKGLPTANLYGLVNTAKAMAWITAELE